MEYFISHVPAILFGAIIVAGIAALWQILTMKNVESRRKKCRARRRETLTRDNIIVYKYKK